MADYNTYSGMAALSICEALLLALNEAQVLPESEIVGALKDAAVTHENAEDTDSEFENHREAAALINGIIAGWDLLQKP